MKLCIKEIETPDLQLMQGEVKPQKYMIKLGLKAKTPHLRLMTGT